MQRRKLRILIITMGGERQEMMRAQFEDEKGIHIEFTKGISSRDLRTRAKLLNIAHEAGLLPEAEYQALTNCGNSTGDDFWNCLSDIPVVAGRRGSPEDVKLHYSVELWRKAKTLNRNRSVLACSMAHLIAMRRIVKERFDLILEDNVRLPKHGLVEKIWEIIDSKDSSDMCYFGWLGSVTNLTWIYESYLATQEKAVVAPLPTLEDLELDMAQKPAFDQKNNNELQPGGNLVWGAYAYWISSSAYERIMKRLQNDVGSLLWKSKKMRFYAVKPIDKILPRTIETFGTIYISKEPVFFRAPMLTSTIHAQWDPSFCQSTDYQLSQCGLQWLDLKLTETERQIVQFAKEHEQWITPAELQNQVESR